MAADNVKTTLPTPPAKPAKLAPECSFVQCVSDKNKKINEIYLEMEKKNEIPPPEQKELLIINGVWECEPGQTAKFTIKFNDGFGIPAKDLKDIPVCIYSLEVSNGNCDPYGAISHRISNSSKERFILEILNPSPKNQKAVGKISILAYNRGYINNQ